LTKSHLDIL